MLKLIGRFRTDTTINPILGIFYYPDIIKASVWNVHSLATAAGRAERVIHQGVDSCHVEAGGGAPSHPAIFTVIINRAMKIVNNTNFEDHIFGP